jgi:hypothetical protein
MRETLAQLAAKAARVCQDGPVGAVHFRLTTISTTATTTTTNKTGIHMPP